MTSQLSICVLGMKGRLLPGWKRVAFTSDESIQHYDAVVVDIKGSIGEVAEDTEASWLVHKNYVHRYQTACERRRQDCFELLKAGGVIAYLVPTPRPISSWWMEFRSPEVASLGSVTDLIQVGASVELCATTAEQLAVSDTAAAVRARDGLEFIAQLSVARAYFEAPNGVEALLHVQGNSARVVASMWRDGEGCVFLLPPPGRHGPTKPGEYVRALEEMFRLFRRKLSGYQALPDFARAVTVPGEGDLTQRVKGCEEGVDRAQHALLEARRDLDEIQTVKHLIGGTGPDLVLAVVKVLKDLGVCCALGTDGREDLVIRFGDSVAVVEVKGNTKSSSENNSRQLQNWETRYREKHGKIPRSILIVNGFCSKPLEKRTEPVFPAQMLATAKHYHQCLVSTLQLLSLWWNHQEGQDVSTDVARLFTDEGLFAYDLVPPLSPSSDPSKD